MNVRTSTHYQPTRKRISQFVKLLVSIAMVLCCSAILEACPTCKEGIAENGADMVSGYGWSIVFMMSMPFLIFTCLCSYFYYEILKARRAAESGAELA